MIKYFSIQLNALRNTVWLLVFKKLIRAFLTEVSWKLLTIQSKGACYSSPVFTYITGSNISQGRYQWMDGHKIRSNCPSISRPARDACNVSWLVPTKKKGFLIPAALASKWFICDMRDVLSPIPVSIVVNHGWRKSGLAPRGRPYPDNAWSAPASEIWGNELYLSVIFVEEIQLVPRSALQRRLLSPSCWKQLVKIKLVILRLYSFPSSRSTPPVKVWKP